MIIERNWKIIHTLHELLKPSSTNNKRALASWIISRRKIIQGFSFSHNKFARHWKLSTATAAYLFLQLFFNIFVFNESSSSFKSTLFRIISLNVINFISPFTNFVWFYFKTFGGFSHICVICILDKVFVYYRFFIFSPLSDMACFSSVIAYIFTETRMFWSTVEK